MIFGCHSCKRQLMLYNIPRNLLAYCAQNLALGQVALPQSHIPHKCLHGLQESLGGRHVATRRARMNCIRLWYLCTDTTGTGKLTLMSAGSKVEYIRKYPLSLLYVHVSRVFCSSSWLQPNKPWPRRRLFCCDQAAAGTMKARGWKKVTSERGCGCIDQAHCITLGCLTRRLVLSR